MNRDQKPDLVLRSPGGGLTILLGGSRGKFRRAPDSPLKIGGEIFVFALADFNGDGQLDIVTGNSEGEARVRLNQEMRGP